MSEDDRRAFTHAMRDVKPLKRTERALPTTRPAAVARLSRAARATTMESLLAAAGELASDDVAFRRPEVSEAAFRRLQRGLFSLEDEIDLHGLTRADARRALKSFVAESVDRGLGCVRVVHGKGSRSGPGGPVLKTMVHECLARWDDVLAFVSARSQHGGNGAVYVLLRRR